MSVKVEIDSILRQLKQNISFFQPMLEAIVNSLEANATDIEVKISVDKQKTLLDNTERISITGYTVIDNGVGFNEDNRNSFTRYLTSYKQKLGCKGIGRFTWLKIFETIRVESYTQNEFVCFDFNKNFSENSFNIEPYSGEKKTIIHFDNVVLKYYEQFKTLKSLDNDESLFPNIDNIKQNIADYLSIKLFLLNKAGINFKIKISLNDKEAEITNSDVVDLAQKNFSLYASLDEGKTNLKYNFTLYYFFDKNYKAIKKHFYCAHGRTVQPFTKSCNFGTLPNNDSSLMLLTSEYYDERINDERNQFDFSLSDNNKTVDNPLPTPFINEKLKEVIDEILAEEYPTLLNDNEKVIQECKDEYPYLSKYISEDTSQIKIREDVISKAKEKYEKEKELIKNNFTKMLEKKKYTDKKVFLENISKVNDISARELAQYFLYREQIISAIKKMKEDESATEADLHNLFMEMGKISNEEDVICSKYDTNLWLLDDKFLTYNCAFSDKKIAQIKQYISSSNEKDYNDNNEPDLAIFYNNVDNSKDLVVVEFKGINAKDLPNGASIYELSRNIYPIVETMTDIRTTYGYIVLNIDERLAKNLSKQPGVKTFSHGDYPIFYIYNENIVDKNNKNVPTHIYILSSESIYMDAASRNKTFLDIIKNT